MLIERKRSSSPEATCRIVSEAARWLKAELKGAAINFSYGRCNDETFDSYATFVITRKVDEGMLVLDIRIAEVGGQPYVFADARPVGNTHQSGFPIFGEIASEDGKILLLHFISDFVLGSGG
ncbi:MAG: hypothetical protein ACFB21_13065 [Opitutales bacterium]